MSRHLQQDLEEAYHRLLALSGQVEEMIHLAVKSLTERDAQTAQHVINLDSVVDQTEVRIEEECLKMLALHQPVAADLRRLTTMMKVNNDLERIADLACNVAERAVQLAREKDFPIPSIFRQMADQTIQMVQDGLKAFVNLDIELAFAVIQHDNVVDQANVDIINELSQVMSDHSEWIDPALHCFSASRHLERIADHATNVAEDVIYMVNGVIVRHRHDSPDAGNTRS